MWVMGSGEGTPRMRAVGVYERTGCRRDRDVSGRKAGTGSVRLQQAQAS